MLEEMRKIDERDMDKLGYTAVDGSEETIAALGDRWWPQTANRQGTR